MIIDRKEEVKKPFVEQCYHYFSGQRYVGAVWLTDEHRWQVFCCASAHKYGHIADFELLEHAEACLKDAIKEL